MTQVTLDLDPEVIRQVEQLAAESGTTVSELLAGLVREKAKQPVRSEPGPLVRQISGIIDLPTDADYRDLIADAMIEKHNSIK
jgi:hypothetical protein